MIMSISDYMKQVHENFEKNNLDIFYKEKPVPGYGKSDVEALSIINCTEHAFDIKITFYCNTLVFAYVTYTVDGEGIFNYLNGPTLKDRETICLDSTEEEVFQKSLVESNTLDYNEICALKNLCNKLKQIVKPLRTGH